MLCPSLPTHLTYPPYLRGDTHPHPHRASWVELVLYIVPQSAGENPTLQLASCVCRSIIGNTSWALTKAFEDASATTTSQQPVSQGMPNSIKLMLRYHLFCFRECSTDPSKQAFFFFVFFCVEVRSFLPSLLVGGGNGSALCWSRVLPGWGVTHVRVLCRQGERNSYRSSPFRFLPSLCQNDLSFFLSF